MSIDGDGMAVVNRDRMRAINRLAILHAIRDAGMISRVDLSRSTGLSQATVTSITAELLKEGMLLEQGGGKSLGGRKPVPLAVNPKGAYAVGIHLSAGQVCVVLLDLQANILNTLCKNLDPGDLSLERVLEILIETVQACIWRADFSKSQLFGIGVSIPGLIDFRTGFVHFIPNYHWKNINLAALLEQRMGVPVSIENSANALVIYKQWFGVGRGIQNFLLITLEQGIGMGMVLNGKIVRGFRGIAGEFGHTVVAENGPLCRCGETGCLEAICGNNAIIRDALEAARRGEWQVNEKYVDIDSILAAAQEGNVALRAIYRRAGCILGVGISNMLKLFNPEKIILSGKGVLAGDLLFGPMSETLHQDISFASDARTPLCVHEWQPTNYARGAGALVLQEAYESPANRLVLKN